MGNMREISIEECNAVFGGHNSVYDTRSYRNIPTRWHIYSYANNDSGLPLVIAINPGSNGGDGGHGYYSESGHFVAPDGKVYKDFQSCVKVEAQNVRDKAAELLGSFGPIGALLANAYSEQGPNRQQENAGINKCHGSKIVRPKS